MFDGFVLAGGKSSRMGTSKARLEIGGKTFAARAADVLRTICGDRVFLVENEKFTDKDFLPEIKRIYDVLPERGALGGIHAALRTAKSGWIAILACDFPFVTGDLFRRLAEIAEQENCEAVAPVQPDGRRQPLCALYRIEPCLQIVENLLTEDLKSPPARILLETVKTRFVEFAEICDLPNAENFFFNVNTPQDFQSITDK